MALRLFHRTRAEAAAAILRFGFKDVTGKYLTTNEYSGVWLSDVPLDVNEGPVGDTLLEVLLDVPEQDLQQYEWIDLPASPAAQPKTWDELKRQAAQPQMPEDNRPPPKTAEELERRLQEPQPGNVDFNALPTCEKLLSSGESKR